MLLKLDKLITLEQEKLNTIKEFRRFLFENILPKENEVNPNIRLSNYEKNWISIDLNKCGKFLKGKGYKKEDVNYSTRASHPIVLYGHLFTDYKPIIKEYLLAKTGLRFGEALALTPNDFDIDNSLLNINKTSFRKARARINLQHIIKS